MKAGWPRRGAESFDMAPQRRALGWRCAASFGSKASASWLPGDQASSAANRVGRAGPERVSGSSSRGRPGERVNGPQAAGDVEPVSLFIWRPERGVSRSAAPGRGRLARRRSRLGHSPSRPAGLGGHAARRGSARNEARRETGRPASRGGAAGSRIRTKPVPTAPGERGSSRSSPPAPGATTLDPQRAIFAQSPGRVIRQLSATMIATVDDHVQHDRCAGCQCGRPRGRGYATIVLG
jgi:hypothetical protein